MKKILMTALAAVIVVAALTGCGKKDVDVTTLATKLLNEGDFAEQLTEVSTEVTEKRCGIDADMVEMCAAFKGTSAVADEIIVIKSSDAKEVNDKLQQHLNNQIKSYESYLPTEVPKLNNAILDTYGDTVILCVSKDSDKAQQIISDYTTN